MLSVIKDARERKGLSQQHLAGAAEVGVRSVQRAEAGERVSAEVLISICAVLGISPEEVQGQDGRRQREADRTEADPVELLRGVRLHRLEPVESQSAWYGMSQAAVRAAAGKDDMVVHAAPPNHDAAGFVRRRERLSIAGAAVLALVALGAAGAIRLALGPSAREIIAADPRLSAYATVGSVTLCLLTMVVAYHTLYGARLLQGDLADMSKVWLVRHDAILAFEVVGGAQNTLRIERWLIDRVDRNLDRLTIMGRDGKAITSLRPRRNMDGSPIGLLEGPGEARKLESAINGTLGAPPEPRPAMDPATRNFLVSCLGLGGLSGIIFFQGGFQAWPFTLPLFIAFLAKAYCFSATKGSRSA